MATAARTIVEAVEAVDPNVRVACTRKTFPGGRRLTHLAVKAGAAILHRAGLSETILVFAEHRAFLDGESLASIATRPRRAAPEKKLAIEVGAVAEAREAIEAGFDVIQLEKFPVAAVAEVAAIARGRASPPLIAAEGGVNRRVRPRRRRPDRHQRPLCRGASRCVRDDHRRRLEHGEFKSIRAFVEADPA